jgi:hypothetical protein
MSGDTAGPRWLVVYTRVLGCREIRQGPDGIGIYQGDRMLGDTAGPRWK